MIPQLIFKYDNSPLKLSLLKQMEKLPVAILMYANTKALEIGHYMRANRKWVDRTGAAKATLQSVVSQPSSKVIRISLSHGVDYGVWLELANEQNYAIIIPTIKQQGPIIIKDLDQFFNSLF